MLRTFDSARADSLLHRAAHFVGLYTGEVVSWTCDGQVWIGFQCGTCGNIQYVHMPRNVNKEEE